MKRKNLDHLPLFDLRSSVERQQNQPFVIQKMGIKTEREQDYKPRFRLCDVITYPPLLSSSKELKIVGIDTNTMEYIIEAGKTVTAHYIKEVDRICELKTRPLLSDLLYG